MSQKRIRTRKPRPRHSDCDIQGVKRGYELADIYLNCGEHGYRRGAFHWFIEDPPVSDAKSVWLVCIDCAERMERDPAFKESCRPAFEEFQRLKDELRRGKRA